jgi:P-type E1-E2 ATPase
MAVGAKNMADQKAIVTHLTALQKIASMNILCSDKTGTLTTAQITIFPDMCWTRGGRRAVHVCLIPGLKEGEATTPSSRAAGLMRSIHPYFRL